MRCANCGFPLSPARTNCPRCGASAGKSEGRPPGSAGAIQRSLYNQQESFETAGGAPEVEVLSQGWDATPWDAQGDVLAPQPAPPAFQQTSDQALFLGANGAVLLSQAGPQSEPPHQGWSPVATAQDWSQQPSADATVAAPPVPGSFPYLSHGSPGQGKQGRSTRFGFTIAGLLLGIGGVLLLLVALIAPGVAVPPATQAQTPAAHQAPTFVPSPVPDSTPVLSPTPTYPAQQYVDTVQLASAVNTRTAQPMTPATSFKVRQQIFVTFTVHPGGHAGAVCLRWFLNNQYYSHYEFPVDATTQPAYSYTFAGVPGPGYVQIYWASTVACTDRLLAQQANFTVTAA
jgi:hypothetical protein